MDNVGVCDIESFILCLFGYFFSLDLFFELSFLGLLLLFLLSLFFKSCQSQLLLFEFFVDFEVLSLIEGFYLLKGLVFHPCDIIGSLWVLKANCEKLRGFAV